MFAIAGGPSFADRPLTWNLFFVRQPEPDLEFTEVWLDEITTIASPSSIKPPKQSRSRPLLWVLFFVLIGGGGYIAMEPEMVTECVGYSPAKLRHRNRLSLERRRHQQQHLRNSLNRTGPSSHQINQPPHRPRPPHR